MILIIEKTRSIAIKAIFGALLTAATIFTWAVDSSAQSTPTPTPFSAGLITGTATGSSHVKRFSETGALTASFFAFSPTFQGGVRVATADMNGDGTADIIVAAGPGGNSHVKIFDGATGAEHGSFFAYPASYTGGVNVAVGDVTGDGRPEIITGTDAGAQGHIKVFDGITLAQIRSFLAFPGFQGGVTVAADDVNGDGFSDIIVGTETGGGRVAVFDGLNNRVHFDVQPFGATFAGGIHVAAGDVNGDGRADIIVGAGAGAPGGHVKVFDGRTFSEIRNFFAFEPNFTGGAYVAVGTTPGDGVRDLFVFVANAAGVPPHVKVFSAATGQEVANFAPYDQGFLGGVSVGAAVPPRRPRAPRVYVNSSWVQASAGEDPDGPGPATEMGFDAFATIQGGVGGGMGGGKVIVSPGTYSGAVLVSTAIDLSGIFTTSGALSFAAPDGSLSPGFSPARVGCGTLTLSGNSTYNVDINGLVAGSQHDQVDVTGGVNLGGAALALAIGYVPAPGHQYTIIRNDGTDPVIGTFEGAPQGATIDAGGYRFSIDYAGGTGNDVVLTATGISQCGNLQIADLTSVAIAPSVEIPVNTTDLSGRGVIAADIKLAYDPTVVSPAAADISVVPGTVAPGATVTYNADTPGTILISMFAPSPFAGGGTLVKINMRPVGSIGQISPLTLTNLRYNGGTVCSAATSGSLKLISGETGGRVTYRNQGFPAPPVPTPTVAVPEVLLSAAGSLLINTATNSSGDYLLSSFGPGAYTVTPSRPAYMSGSNNGIFANDAALIARQVVGLVSLSPVQIEAATVNGFGMPLSSFDAGLIAQWIVGINLPGNRTGQWSFTPPFTTPNVNLNNTQNYGALLLGDVNGDWNPLGPRPAGVIEDAEESSRAVTVSLGSIKAVHGSEFTVPLSLTNMRDLSADSYQFDIEFDADVISPAQIAADLSGSVADGLSIFSFSPERGVLKVAVYGTLPVTGDGVYANLHFTANAKPGAKTGLTISNFRIGDGSVNVVTTGGEVSVVGNRG